MIYLLNSLFLGGGCFAYLSLHLPLPFAVLISVFVTLLGFYLVVESYKMSKKFTIAWNAIVALIILHFFGVFSDELTLLAVVAFGVMVAFGIFSLVGGALQFSLRRVPQTLPKNLFETACLGVCLPVFQCFGYLEESGASTPDKIVTVVIIAAIFFGSAPLLRRVSWSVSG